MNYTNKKKTCLIYKNDLKFNNEINLLNCEFESDTTKKIYDNFKNKPKIELRIEDSKMENYRYLDLSNLKIDDEFLIKLFNLESIKKILEKIEFLDLSNNILTLLPNLKIYPNILYLSISFNQINQDIYDNNLLELTCHNNNIKSIKSNKLTRLNASNNNINNIDVPNINILIINHNKLIWIPSYLKLKYLECIGNQINKIDSMCILEELYIGQNKISNISNMPKLKILNCVENPLLKIKYFSKLQTLMSSIAIVSSQYQISNITKIKSDFKIDFIPYE